jgi:hypothetical protein
MRTSLIKPLMASAFLAGSLGCASMANGRFERIEVESTPAGTDVNVICDGARVDSGVTPASLRIRRGSASCELGLAHDGYESATVPLVRAIAPMYWANLVLAAAMIPAIQVNSDGGIGSGAVSAGLGAVSVGGLAGLVIDRNNGSMYRHTPQRVEVTLRRK